MRHILFKQNTNNTYKVALLIKPTNLVKYQLEINYVNPLVSLGIPEDDIIAFDLSYSTKKPSGQEKKDYCKALIKALTSLGVTHILCNDSEYYKTLTNSKKAGHTHGVATECVFNTNINVFLGVNYSAFIYDPKQKDKLDTSIKYLVDDINGVSNVIGSNVIKYEEYIHNLSSESIWIDALNRLNQYQELTVDIETFSLNPWKAGIATIAFAWNKHEGICFALDCEPDSNGMTKRALGNFDYLLKEFFLNYRGKLIAHKATFDFTVIVARLFMKNRANIEGMFEGIDCLTKWFDDSQLCLYLATNSTSRNELSLKVAAQPYLGNYEEGSIDNLGSIKYSDLLLYNLKDVLGTWFVFDTYHPKMIEDQQHVLYEAVLKPSVAVIVQMQLVGLPLDYEACKHAQSVLQSDLDTATAVLNQSSYITTLLGVLRQKESDACHAKWKAKTAPIEHFDYVEYNPNSGLQNQILIYEVMGFTPTVFTDKKQPSTSNKAIKKLIKLTDDPDKLEVLNALVHIADASIILNNFISAFLNDSITPEIDPHYIVPYTIHSHYHLGGTVSGRLSSSDVNGQNLPSGGTKYGKLIKHCVKGSSTWLYSGADFSSLNSSDFTQ